MSTVKQIEGLPNPSILAACLQQLTACLYVSKNFQFTVTFIDVRSSKQQFENVLIFESIPCYCKNS